MDCEEGVEVVWNEVQFSERKSYKAQEVIYPKKKLHISHLIFLQLLYNFINYQIVEF